jgi:PAS domain S-box-containing protein
MGSDEFGRLSNDINGLIQSLEDSKHRLLRSERQFSVVFSEMLSGFALNEIISDKNGTSVNYKFLEVNPAFERITGLKRENILGKTVKEVLPETEEEWIVKLGNVAKTGESLHIERYNQRLDRYFEVLAFSLGAGQFAVSFFDITERKNAELEREKIYAQLLHSQKMEAIGTFAGGIAHDFNNLLCAIQGYAELMRREKALTPLMEKGLSIIYDASSKGTTLIKQLLTFSRKTKVELQPVNLNQRVENAVKILERLIPRMISIDLHLVPNLDVIKGDANQIEQIIMNLAINARDAMPDGGTLRIETNNIVLDHTFVKSHAYFKPGAYTLLQVTDTGCGINKQDIKHIFEPFFTTKEAGKGTGLGLATVYGIVKSHNGYITCDSTEGSGAIFRLYFPVCDTAFSGKVKSDVKEGLRGTETILVIDDEVYICNFLSTVLGQFGYNVIYELDAKSGIRKFGENPASIGLVIMDMVMPVMSGNRCLEEIIKINPAVKAILISGYELNEREKPVDANGVGFIKKPFDKNELLEMIRTKLDGQGC